MPFVCHPWVVDTPVADIFIMACWTSATIHTVIPVETDLPSVIGLSRAGWAINRVIWVCGLLLPRLIICSCGVREDLIPDGDNVS